MEPSKVSNYQRHIYHKKMREQAAVELAPEWAEVTIEPARCIFHWRYIYSCPLDQYKRRGSRNRSLDDTKSRVS